MITNAIFKDNPFGIFLTYKYNRDVFLHDEFKPWIKKLFGDCVKFHGFAFGRSEPTIQIHVSDFEKHKDEIPTSNLIQIRGFFSVVEQLSMGIRNFKNQL